MSVTGFDNSSSGMGGTAPSDPIDYGFDTSFYDQTQGGDPTNSVGANANADTGRPDSGGGFADAQYGSDFQSPTQRTQDDASYDVTSNVGSNKKQSYDYSGMDGGSQPSDSGPAFSDISQSDPTASVGAGGQQGQPEQPQYQPPDYTNKGETNVPNTGETVGESKQITDALSPIFTAQDQGQQPDAAAFATLDDVTAQVGGAIRGRQQDAATNQYTRFGPGSDYALSGESQINADATNEAEKNYLANADSLSTPTLDELMQGGGTFTTPSGQTVTKTGDGADYSSWTIPGADNRTNVLYNDNGNWRAVSRDQAAQLQQQGATGDRFTSVSNAASIAGQAMQSTGTTPQTPGFEQRALQAAGMIATAPFVGAVGEAAAGIGPPTVSGTALLKAAFFDGLPDHVSIPDRVPLVGGKDIQIPDVAQHPMGAVLDNPGGVQTSLVNAVKTLFDSGPSAAASQIASDIRGAFTQDPQTYATQQGLQDAGILSLAAATISVHNPVSAVQTNGWDGLKQIITATNPVKNYEDTINQQVAAGVPFGKAVDVAYQDVHNKVMDVLWQFVPWNPINEVVTFPTFEKALEGLLKPKTTGAIEGLADGTTTFSSGTYAAGKQIIGQRLDENVLSKAFDTWRTGAAQQLSDMQISHLAEPQNIADWVPLRGQYLDGMAALARGDTAAARTIAADIAATYGTSASGELAHMQAAVSGVTKDLVDRNAPGLLGQARAAVANVSADADTAGGILRTAAGTQKLADVASYIANLSQKVTDGVFTARDLQVAARRYGIDLATATPEDLAAIRGQAAREAMAADIRNGWYAHAGVDLPGTGSVLRQSYDGLFNVTRGILLAASAPALALQKFTDEYGRAGLQGVWGIRLADTGIGQGAARLVERTNLLGQGERAGRFAESSTVRQMLASGANPAGNLLNSPKADYGVLNAFTGKNRYGEAMSVTDRLAAIAGAPGRAVDKWNQSLISAPTQHVLRNAAYQELTGFAAKKDAIVQDAFQAILTRTGDYGAATDAAYRLANARSGEQFMREAMVLDAKYPRLGATDAVSASPRVPARSLPNVAPRTLPLDANGKAPLPNQIAPQKYAAATPEQIAKDTKKQADAAVQWAQSFDQQGAGAGRYAWTSAPTNVVKGAEKLGVGTPNTLTQGELADAILKANDVPKVTPIGRDLGTSAGAGTSQPIPKAGDFDIAAGGGGMGYLSPTQRSVRDNAQEFGDFRTRDASHYTTKGAPRTDAQTTNDLRARPAKDQLYVDLQRPGGAAARLDALRSPLPGESDAQYLAKIKSYGTAAGTESTGIRENLQMAKQGSSYEADLLRKQQELTEFRTGLQDIRAQADPAYNTKGAQQARERLVPQRAAQSDQWQYGEAMGQREAPQYRDGAIPNRTDPTEMVGTLALGSGEVPARPLALDRGVPRVPEYNLRPDSQYLANGGGVMLTPEAANAPRLAAESRAGTMQYRLDQAAAGRERANPASLGSTPLDHNAGLPDRYSPRFSPFAGAASELPTRLDVPIRDMNTIRSAYGGAAGDLRALGGEMNAARATGQRTAYQRGASIVGNQYDQTTLGAFLKNGAGVVPPILPFAPFHIHSTQYWGKFFAEHPIAAVQFAQGVDQLDDYGTMQLPGGVDVRGLVKLTTGAHLADWAKKAYEYATDVRAQGNNNLAQQIGKSLAYNTVGNNAFVRPFDYITTPAVAQAQQHTNPLMGPKGKVDNRDVFAEYGTMAGTSGVGQLVNDRLGTPIPRNIVTGATNPGQALGGAVTRGMTDLTGATLKPYNFESQLPYFAGDYAQKNGISAAAVQAALYNPKSSADLALANQITAAYQRRMDFQGATKLSPVQIVSQGTAPGIFPPFDKNAPVSYSPGGATGKPDFYVNQAEFPDSPGFDIQQSATARAMLKSPDQAVRAAAETYLNDNQSKAFQSQRMAGEGGKDAGVGVPAGSYTDKNGVPNGYYVESPETARYATARADIAKATPVSPDAVPGMDYNRAYLQNPDIAALGSEKQQQSLAGEIAGNAKRTGAGLPQEQRTAQIAKEQQLQQPVGTNPDGTPFTLGDLFQQSGLYSTKGAENAAIKAELSKNPIAAAYLAKEDASYRASLVGTTTGDPKKDGLNVGIDGTFTVGDFLRQPGNLFDIEKRYSDAKARGASPSELAAILKEQDAVLASDLATHPQVRAYFDATGQTKYAENPNSVSSNTSGRGGLSPSYNNRTTSTRNSRTSSYGTTSRSTGSTSGRGSTPSVGQQQAGNDFYTFYGTLTDKGEKAAVLNALDKSGINPLGQKGVSAQEYQRALSVAKDALSTKRAADILNGAGRDTNGQRPQGMTRAQAEYAIAQMDRQAGTPPASSRAAVTSTTTSKKSYSLPYPGKKQAA